MYFWLKFFHIVAVTVWFSGLFLFPRMLWPERAGALATGKTLFFLVMTPAAVAAITLGAILVLGFGYSGAWLPLKLFLVSVAVILHMLMGYLLSAGTARAGKPGRPLALLLNWLPLLLFLLVAALTAGKPMLEATAPAA